MVLLMKLTCIAFFLIKKKREYALVLSLLSISLIAPLCAFSFWGPSVTTVKLLNTVKLSRHLYLLAAISGLIKKIVWIFAEEEQYPFLPE